ncbi:MAG: ATP-binding protein [Candidatus Magasanikbacteria bacterium]|nr:ATP-binding protein [Candidatus Magasanikbacteria bacterium]
MIKTYIPRKIYLERITPFIDKEVIKVIIGQRRVGKSYLLFQIMDIIKGLHKNPNLIYINKELNEFDGIKNYRDLLAYIKQKTRSQSGKHYVFIDEIQEIEKFEKALRGLQAKGGYDLYCTGSNAYFLSSELATHLSGRAVEIPVFGLSYAEFLEFHKLKESHDAFIQYIKYGGLPYLMHLAKEDAVVYDYLRNIYNTILFKDVVSVHKIRNLAFLGRLVEYLADNLGSLVSAKKISDFLKSQKIKISPGVVLDYLSFLAQAFFIFQVRRSDIQGKKVFEINEKYYFGDLGLRHAIVSYHQPDINKVLENLVFLHLLVAGYTVTVGQQEGGREVDFVCEKAGQRLYVQVAYLITEENKEREFGNLLAIRDNYPKIVVSMDELLVKGGYKGVRQENIRDFLSHSI